jgi:hypothetical protein
MIPSQTIARVDSVASGSMKQDRLARSIKRLGGSVRTHVGAALEPGLGAMKLGRSGCSLLLVPHVGVESDCMRPCLRAC